MIVPTDLDEPGFEAARKNLEDLLKNGAD